MHLCLGNAADVVVGDAGLFDYLVESRLQIINRKGFKHLFILLLHIYAFWVNLLNIVLIDIFALSVAFSLIFSEGL